MAFSCIKASPEKRGLFTLQVCSCHYWYTDYDYATAILVGAGNTKNRCASGNGMAVYPRWRGEHTKRISFFIKHFLSSPHSTNIIATI
ncbi:hypothetical protein VL83_00680 [Salmonella enterica subsp. enterica serovar Montevideo]|uniref:Uncharacterized protein n=2 Tax=Salmonella montevideo TaxID=115981 RepID=A0A725HQI9_SALMO|nr:hypothetical protein [Salmonella enterica subsp. enterica serovar Montevideo]EBO9850032.1 hypothetical protein [Salmonella enterica]EBL5251322.1 hypothetical protein [Salmonella enterica subsp. enterica serovar Montevideo]EBL5760842.1 hypothetical protein [Salmonella enterica subsp. enterica serovar Montevideo]EBS2685329.1 hypothetical protein [Salmonella enterica subsp. enterica serovar Montevideo]